MELARPAGVEDRTACAHLLALALGAAATMRGGPALVGDATPATLLERWTSPEGASALFVGEYEGAVVGVLGLTEAHTANGPRSLVECCFVEDGARGRRRRRRSVGGCRRMEHTAQLRRDRRRGPSR